ncbi:hypothetical protein MSG28_009422 [Choristoneura fumiferana]|uniref:Uncharacterized protein n=1 Tax=Choristoneura fumiferana TaxID=7141 RepID=A0ACC0KX99_CHOFU|nr:hypothetical protein MSG28_009422 [Choristoneura fumiferana]
MPKDKENSLERIKKKLRRLERKLKSRSRTRSRSPFPMNHWESEKERSETPLIWEPTEEPEQNNHTEEQEQNIDHTEKAETMVSAEVLKLLGEAPEEVGYGPDLLPQICSRWQGILKKGLEKAEKVNIVKKYPPPANFKLVDAPKLNPEAQAAAGENVIKRDKAIEAKQKQVSCALIAIGQALNKLCKAPQGNEDIITLLSDSGRLLCDYHHAESSTRKQFLLTGLENKTAREALKDTEVDQWLFGENLADKLKASKAIERSSKDLRGSQNKTKRVQNQLNNPNNLNFKGPANNVYKPKTQGQRLGYQSQPYQKKQAARPFQPRVHQKQHQQHYNSRR